MCSLIIEIVCCRMLGTVRNNLETGAFLEAIEGIEKTKEEFPSCPLFVAAANYPLLGNKENSYLEESTSHNNTTLRAAVNEAKLNVLHDLLKAVYIGMPPLQLYRYQSF